MSNLQTIHDKVEARSQLTLTTSHLSHDFCHMLLTVLCFICPNTEKLRQIICIICFFLYQFLSLYIRGLARCSPQLRSLPFDLVTTPYTQFMQQQHTQDS
jgi:hypothetical protein